MKVSAGSRHETLSGMQEEARGKGTATLMDNRSFTVTQRKLRASMDASSTKYSNPIQRKLAKGPPRFQQIAMSMGDEYGVDTSSLVATQNSPFPAQLRAEATIQGNNIHFGPGMDTDSNIKHEVAHAIDNTLHGTPKGNHSILGQKVDTTREEKVEKMVNGSTWGKKQGANPIQKKANVNTNEIIQLKKIDKNRLNVIGEDHDISGKPLRSKAEDTLAEKIFGDKLDLLGENELQFDLGQNTYYGDDPVLIYLNTITLLHMAIKGDWDTSKQLAYLDILIDEGTHATVSMVREKLKANTPRLNHFNKGYRLVKNQLLKIRFEISSGGRVKDKLKTNQTLTSIFGEFRSLGPALRGPDSALTRFNFEISYARSLHMHDRANLYAQLGNKGIWKVGENHAKDMEGIKGKKHYHLIRMDEFDAEYFP